MKKESKDVGAFVRTYDLILWIIPTLDKFPRRQKFLLADRIQTTLLDILGWITEAVYTKDKASALKKANLGIELNSFIQGWIGHVKHANRFNLRKELLSPCVEARGIPFYFYGKMF